MLSKAVVLCARSSQTMSAKETPQLVMESVEMESKEEVRSAIGEHCPQTPQTTTPSSAASTAPKFLGSFAVIQAARLTAETEL